MRCSSTSECLKQIREYFDGEKTGYFLLVNAENLDDYQNIRNQLEADGSKNCVYISQNCFPNGLPDVETGISKVDGLGQYILIGLSQALMLHSGFWLEQKLDEVLSHSISGYGIVLLEHCEHTLQKFISRDIRLENRVIFVDGETSPLSQIKLARVKNVGIDVELLENIPELLAYLEHLTESEREAQPIITVLSSHSVEGFKNAVFSVTESEGIYEALIKQYPDVAGATEKRYGTDAQWGWLASKLKEYKNLAALICDVFGATANLSAHISDIWETDDERSKWLLWLALKSFGEKSNHYLMYVLENCESFDSFETHIYLDFANIDLLHPEFDQYYIERKRLISYLPENLSLVKEYCDKLGRYQKNEVFYLTDGSEQEKYNFVKCLSLYEFTADEVFRATRSMSKALHLYMQEFVFDELNTKLPESDENFRKHLTEYFTSYKMQKLTNQIFTEFLEKVDAYALSPRPFNKLRPRSMIVSHMNKENTQCFFFDALGVEYLAFIKEKCKEYDLVSEISIGRCELPSITEKNKEFLQYFAEGDWKKIDSLDEIKHHSLIYDYRKCEYPLHLFEELDIIDKQLREIHSMLIQGTFEKALIVADHGASRLAVRYGHELETSIEMEESGEHSGRCCPVAEDPKIPYAAYEDGFSILANYERFKGGRRANVEVHGGATLEEVVVPIITLMKQPDNIEICFVNSTIELKPHITPELVLYSNVPLNSPRLLIEDEFYEGTFVADQKHAKFEIKKIRRKGNYFADVYDGSKDLSIRLEFKAQKQTHEVDLF